MDGVEGVRPEAGGMRPTALGHLGVVDLTDLRGALAGRMLAELGADVVKVEPPDGDPGRLRPPFAGGEGGTRPLPAVSLPQRGQARRGRRSRELSRAAIASSASARGPTS